MTSNNPYPMLTRKLIYLAMVVLLAAIFIGAYRNAPPIYLAVHTGLGYGFLKEMIRTMLGRGTDFTDDQKQPTASQTAERTG